MSTTASIQTQIARVMQAVYDVELGKSTLALAVAAADSAGGLAPLMNAVYTRDLAVLPVATLAARMVQNFGITGSAAEAGATAYITAALQAAAPGARGAVLLDLVNLLPTLTADPIYGAAASKFIASVDASLAYAQSIFSFDTVLPGGVFDPALAPWLHIDATPAPAPAPRPPPPAPPPPPPAPVPPPPPSVTVLDVKALSDSVALAIGSNSLPDEGLEIALTATPSLRYKIDANNDGVISPGEITLDTVVLGVDNVITGNANDRVLLGVADLGRSNIIDLGAQQDNIVIGTLREGADVVTYQHLDLNRDGLTTAADAPLRPTLTIAVDAASSAKVTAAGGILDTVAIAPTTDTLRNVEIINVVDAALSDRYDDRLDLSALAGATVNFGAAEAVGKSQGGGTLPPTTVAQLDGNTLDAGGISLAGTPLGSEAITVQGLPFIERVTGTAGDDRVILGAAASMQSVTSGAFAAKDSPRPTASDQSTAVAGGFVADLSDWPSQGLYQFNLGAGNNDTLDYRQETLRVLVSVGTAPGAVDDVFIGLPGTGRIDIATGVERYFGGTGGGAGQNWIDLAAATVPTTVRFSKEAAGAASPEYAEPNGNNGVVTSGLTRSAEVQRTSDGVALATFTDRTGAGIVPASLWLNVQGSALAETVILTDNESADVQRLQLAGGANRVDYSALTLPIFAALGAVDVTAAALPQQSTVNGDVVQQFWAGDRASNGLTLVASTRNGDLLDVSALANGMVALADPARPTTSQVDPQFHVVDLVRGTVTESVYGQYVPVGSTVVTARAFVTQVSGFENASNAGDADAVHLLGDNGRNTLTGGNAVDLIVGGRGTAGDGSADVGGGSRGDRLTGGTGADVFLYRGEAESPGGTIAGGQQAASDFAANETNVVNSRDTVTDFVAGVDKLAFAIDDGYDAVRVVGAIPASLASSLNSVSPIVTTFAAGDTRLDIPRDAAAVAARQADNYRIDTTAATLTRADLDLRVAATGGGDVIDASAGLATGALNAASADGVRVDLVYTDKSQSQSGGFDQLLHFTSGSDKIDLSFLKLARYESQLAGNGVDFDTNHNNVVDALESGLVRVLGAAPVFAVNSPAANLFIDGTVYRPIAVQTAAGAGGVSTTVFIDADGDGNYVPGNDMVLVLVGVAAPTSADFIIDQYGGGWGG